MRTTQLARTWFQEVWNNKNVSAINELSDPETFCLAESGELSCPDDFRRRVFEPMISALPDIQLTVDGTVSEDDQVVVRWTAVATHSGALGDIEPSGRRVKFSGMTWLKIEEDKITSASDSYNLNGLLTFLATGEESATVRSA